jgi:hypothetical protein
MVSLDQKQVVLDKLATMLPTVNPYSMDNWGWYPNSADWSKSHKEPSTISIGSIETDTQFMIRASHPNYPPNWYVEFAKSLTSAKLLYQDLDGYGENTTWNLCDTTTKLSKWEHTIDMNMYYSTPMMKRFTNEFVGHS